MSPTYFCRYFHQEMGKTPFAFLNEYRIKKAAILLDDSSLSVSDIAINCGFDNISYFIRKFKEYQGIPQKIQKPEDARINKAMLQNCEGIRIEVPPILKRLLIFFIFFSYLSYIILSFIF